MDRAAATQDADRLPVHAPCLRGKCEDDNVSGMLRSQSSVWFTRIRVKRREYTFHAAYKLT